MVKYTSAGGATIELDCEVEHTPGLCHFLLSQIDGALVARAESLIVELDALRQKTSLIAITARAIIADATKSDAQSCVEIDALAAQALMSKQQRDRAAAIKARDEAQAVVDALPL